MSNHYNNDQTHKNTTISSSSSGHKERRNGLQRVIRL